MAKKRTIKKQGLKELNPEDYSLAELEIKLNKEAGWSNRDMLLRFKSRYTNESLENFHKSKLVSKESKDIFKEKVAGRATQEFLKKMEVTQELPLKQKPPEYYKAINEFLEGELDSGQKAKYVLEHLMAVKKKIVGKEEFDKFINEYASPHVLKELGFTKKPSEDEIRERKRKGEEIENILKDYPNLTKKQKAAYIRNWGRKSLKKEKWSTVSEGINDLRERFKWSEKEVEEYLKENFTKDSLKDFYTYTKEHPYEKKPKEKTGLYILADNPDKFRESFRAILEQDIENIKKVHPKSHYNLLTKKLEEGLKQGKRLDIVLLGLHLDPEIQEKINLEDPDVLREYFLKIAPENIKVAAEKVGLLEAGKSTKEVGASLEEARKADEMSVLKDAGKMFKDTASYIVSPSKIKKAEVKEDITNIFEDLGYKLKNVGKGIYEIVGKGTGAVKNYFNKAREGWEERQKKKVKEEIKAKPIPPRVRREGDLSSVAIRNAKKIGDYLKKDLENTVEDAKKVGSFFKKDYERTVEDIKGVGNYFKKGYKRTVEDLKHDVSRKEREKRKKGFVEDAKKLGKAGLAGLKGVGAGIYQGFKAGKYVVGGGINLGWKVVKPGFKLAGDLVDRVEENYEKIEKKLKAIRPHYILFLLLISAVALFSLSTPSTTTFILFTPENNQLNYKVLFGTILFILAVYITHKETKTL